MKKLLSILLLGLSVILTNCTQQGETYKNVKIGEQVWMSENLNVEKFRNGDPIPEAKSNEEWITALRNEQPAWCYYNNDPLNGPKYGKIYNFFAVEDPRGLAPKGWRIPTEADWNLLVNFLGGKNYAGAQLKSDKYWGSLQSEESQSGFNATPGGERIGLNSFSSGKFNNEGLKAYYWTSTKYDRGAAAAFLISQYSTGAYGGKYDNHCGYSVRCIKDEQ